MDAIFWIGVIISFILGVITTYLTRMIDGFLIPKLIVSKNLLFSPLDHRFRIKILNGSKRQIVDLKFSLFLIEREPSPIDKNPNLGKLKKIKRFSLNRKTIPALEGKHKKWGIPIAYTLYTEAFDKNIIDEIFDETQTLERRVIFEIDCRDGITNTRIVKRYLFSKEDIILGKFGPKLSLIIEEPLANSEFTDSNTNDNKDE